MTKATKSRFLLMMTLTATLVVALIGTAVCGVAAAASSPSVVVQTTPALPLFDVVFLATTSAGTDKTLFVSSTSDCSTRLTPICTLGRSQTGLNYNDTTCVFNITGSSLSIDATTTTAIPSLYWCSSAAGSISFETLQMNKVVATPSYAYLNKDTTLTLNAATPVGSTVGFYTTSTCTTMLDGATATTVTSSRKLSVNVVRRFLLSWVTRPCCLHARSSTAQTPMIFTRHRAFATVLSPSAPMRRSSTCLSPQTLNVPRLHRITSKLHLATQC